MAGIYIHIPFCRKACHYCNFHFSTSHGLINNVVEAICKEAALRSDYIHEPAETIYFGGGTPSLLNARQLTSILEAIRRNFDVTPEAEITLEANPDDISEETLAYWKHAGINRLSIGIQSFFERDLSWMNRAHSASQAYNSVVLAQAAGFSNITIDLIYGTPGLTNEDWSKNIETALALQIPHLSCYALTVEEGTALHHKIKKGQLPNTDNEQQSTHFEILMNALNEAGYVHYEISNFAKPGMESKHNSSYWQGKPYVGLGPSAHSFNGTQRQWNVANNALYIQSINENEIPAETETLTVTQQLNEAIMIALRTNKGISLSVIEQRFSAERANELVKNAQRFVENGILQRTEDHLILTKEGKFLADGIASDLFF